MNKSFFKFFLPFFFLGAILAYFGLGILENQDFIKTTILKNPLEEDAISRQDHFNLQDYYQTDRIIQTAFLTQIKTESAEENQINLQAAAQNLFENLKNKSQNSYSRIIVLFDPEYTLEGGDPFYAQALKAFPKANYKAIDLNNNQSEAEIYRIIENNFSTDTLIILHAYQLQNPSDPHLLEISKLHFKNAFDNFFKQNLINLPLSNQEALKAVYQINKEVGNLKVLPALENQEHQFTIRYLTKGPRHQSEIVTITFFGDMMFGRYVRTLMDRHGLDYPLQNIDQNYLLLNDLLVANLEGPIARKAINTTKSIAFRFMPDTAKLLKKYHFDALSLANNHALDMGAAGLSDSFELLNAEGLSPFGHPRDINQDSVFKTIVNGRKIAILGLNDTDFRINQDKKEQAIQTIHQLGLQGYQVIIYIHWGNEYQHRPQDYQVEMAHQFIDAGAIALIGHHAHVVQSFEIYNSAPIFYSLGNFIFDQYFSDAVQEGLTTTLVFNQNSIDVYFFPIKIELSKARLMNAEEKAEFLTRFTGYWRYDEQQKAMIEQGKITIGLP